MFRANPQPPSAQEEFRQAAEAFLQSVDLSEDETPWALILLNTMGEMIEQNAKQRNPVFEKTLIEKMLKDVEFAVTEGKYKNNPHGTAFATAIRNHIDYLEQRTPAEGASVATNPPDATNIQDAPAEGTANPVMRV